MRNLPQVYSQQDLQWASLLLGSGPATIGNSGCYETSFAMIACYYGNNINPSQLNTSFITGKDYVDGDELTDDDLQSVYSKDIYQQTVDYSNTPADLIQLQTLLSDPTVSVILEVNANPEGPDATLDTHFVVAVDCDGTNVTIADPWTGQIVSGIPYGNWATTIQKFVVYKGTPATTDSSTDDEDAINAEKAVQFDRALTALKNAGIISTDDSNQYISSNSDDNDGFVTVITNFITNFQSQEQRAGWYDQVCLAFGYTGDTTKFDSNALVALINDTIIKEAAAKQVPVTSSQTTVSSASPVSQPAAPASTTSEQTPNNTPAKTSVDPLTTMSIPPVPLQQQNNQATADSAPSASQVPSSSHWYDPIVNWWANL